MDTVSRTFHCVPYTCTLKVTWNNTFRIPTTSGVLASTYGHTEGYSESSKFWNNTNLDLVFIVIVLKLNCTIFNHFRDHYHLVFIKSEAWRILV